MTVKIEKKITGYAVAEPVSADVAAPDKELQPALMDRPERLIGNTYKVKPPISEYALYITINDIVVNEGTPDEQRKPFEVFINSKNMEHFQWIVALTRVISAVFRKGGDVTFLVEELKSVFDPRGGYFQKGGKYIPSLVAEIGVVIEQHMHEIGLLQKPELDAHQQQLVDAKRAEVGNAGDNGGYPPGAQLCGKCHTKAVVKSEGCNTCLFCGDSKCS